jgi:hypothetical protein
VKKQVNIVFEEGKITLNGDSSYILTVFNKLKKSEIAEYVIEDSAIKKAKKLRTIYMVSVSILLIVVILMIF